MAEDLEDGEFWLPSQFLSDDDVVMDFDMSIIPHIGSSASFSDFGFTESDDDNDGDVVTHHSSCPVHTIVNEVLSSSPQSTLYRCVCNQSSSRESVSPPQPQPQGEATTTATATATFDLLNKAADEMARLKITMENENNNNNKKVIGTGFFDCTKQTVSYPPLLNFPPQFLHFPSPIVSPPTKVQQEKKQPPPPPSQNRATKNENKPKNNRPLGLPPSAWPPLQAQPPPKSKAQIKSTGASSGGPPKGTGVFLPRCVPTTPANQPKPQPLKKDGNATKMKNGKGSQPQSNHRRTSSKASATTTTTTMTTNLNDIQLPQEWIY